LCHCRTETFIRLAHAPGRFPPPRPRDVPHRRVGPAHWTLGTMQSLAIGNRSFTASSLGAVAGPVSRREHRRTVQNRLGTLIILMVRCVIEGLTSATVT
jgi:hypothetical protein